MGFISNKNGLKNLNLKKSQTILKYPNQSHLFVIMDLNPFQSINKDPDLILLFLLETIRKTGGASRFENMLEKKTAPSS